MRLQRLDLLRYGHFAGESLDFTSAAPLQVVHGVNEAGKSTALAAIADGLFGFGHRTAYDFQHGGPQLRIGFSLQARDGASGSFVRRKGKSNTLRDGDDAALPDDALRRFLGGADRDLFERSFGLDGARLREGGHELLRSGGEAGESLMASTGLANLRLALKQLEDEAKLLFGDGRGKRRLSEAVERWRLAQRASEDASVKPRAWEDASQALAAVQAEMAKVQAEASALAIEDNRLQRVRRVAPVLAGLDAARAALAEMAAGPTLPADAQARWLAASAERREATRDEAREQDEVARLQAALSALQQDVAVLALQGAIDALAASQEKIAQAAADLPKVEAEIARRRMQCERAVADLGLDITPEAARDAVPAADVRRAVQRMVSQHAALAAKSEAASDALKAALRERDAAAGDLANRPPGGEGAAPDLLRRTIEAVRGQGRLDSDLARTRAALDQASARTFSALAALPMWDGDIEALAACALPLETETAVLAAKLEEAAAGAAECSAASGRLRGELAEADEGLAALRAGGPVPTEELIGAARARRDHVWRAVRRMVESRAAAGAERDSARADAGVAELGAGLPDQFESLRDEADRLADRRAAEAERVAAFVAGTARVALLRERVAEADAAETEAAGAQAQAQAAWARLWSATKVPAQSPQAMAEWRRAREQVLALLRHEQESRLAHEDVRLRRDQALADLRSACPELAAPLAAPESLSAAMLMAETLCARAEAAQATARDQSARLARETARLPALQDAARDAADAMAAWHSNWSPAVARLHLPPGAVIDTAEAALTAWAQIAELGPAWRSDAVRVADMRASIAGFAERVRAIEAKLEDSAAAPDDALVRDAEAVAKALVRRLAAARRAQSAAELLLGQLRDHEASAERATHRLKLAGDEFAALRRLAEAADDAALEQAIERAKLRQDATARLEQSGRDLLAQGDGLGEDALRAEAEDVLPDQAASRLTEMEAERTRLGALREKLSAERVQGEMLLQSMQGTGDAAQHAQDAQDALADAREAAGKYARVHTARVLLRAGIERFRAEQQGPLLRAAGSHFALLTGGRYVRLGLDEDGGRTVLVGVRGNGMECPVEALSEGTRDQLYFALRVAAIEAYSGRAEPLPFIADDLLVHFDDTRAGAAISLLAELGRTTQVILFTHHDHIARMAGERNDVAVQRLEMA